MTERATCWSITINNPQEDEVSKLCLPAGWKMTGQLERGQEGTLHYQGMLTTPQVRFSAVKKHIPRAHIEVARSKAALQKYVDKQDTCVKKVDTVVSRIPTLFEYQDVIAAKWDEQEFSRRWKAATSNVKVPHIDEVAMCYLDSLVAADIESGRRGAEYIAINPMWRASWSKFWRSIINRHGSSLSQPPPHAPAPQQAAGSPSDTPGGAWSPGSPSFSGDLPVD